MKSLILTLLFFLSPLLKAQEPAEETTTDKGTPFGEWIWDKQLRPTIEASWDFTGKTVFFGSLAASALAHQHDEEIYDKTRSNPNLIMNRSATDDLAFIGSGVFGVGIALTQLVFDKSNGLMHSRAIILTTISHVSMAALVQRARPGDREDYLPFKSSFPSGHASSAFATAASLAYAYGWKVGVPAYSLAAAISLSRVAENAHWASDVVMGAGLGIFWARASYQHESQNPSDFFWTILPTEGGARISASKSF